MSFKDGLAATIIEIDQFGFAHVQDQLGKMHRINATVARAKGLRPQVGEVWIIKRDIDRREMTFAAVMGESVVPPVVTGSRSSGAALGSLLQALDQLGVITDDSTP